MNNNKSVSSELAEEAVNSIEEVAGKYPGYRRAHAKGVVYQAVFTPNGQAGPLTTAAHLQNHEVQALVRFSNSSTNPSIPDVFSPAKGMAVQFVLPDGGVTSLVTITLPIFFAKTPQSFINILRTIKENSFEGATIADKFKAVMEKYSESRAGLQAVKMLQPPLSFATNRYHSIHAYYFINAAGERRAIKYEWEPEAGLHFLVKEEVENRSPDYLEDELIERLSKGPVTFQLTVILGQKGDPTDDPTSAWPEDRERIVVGHLSITGVADEKAQEYVFDPTVVPAGIECSEDPILNFRHDAYAESHSRRSTSQ
ncbi:catalase family peroxidase [Paenibacillus sp. FSL L8-0323]|uniref:catalase family peroxidase n=1 Tax=Paenibacillus TaxID=44249 RepID=UPI00096BE87C|nr:catalase family peroxidase [Paenibacillus odorifer]OMD17394.1 catalase [Paenibacillus odorifer]